MCVILEHVAFRFIFISIFILLFFIVFTGLPTHEPTILTVIQRLVESYSLYGISLPLYTIVKVYCYLLNCNLYHLFLWYAV